MYIAPDGIIKVLKGVPLDNTYEHTIYFDGTSAGRQAQYNFFNSKAKYTFPAQSYSRVNRGFVKVDRNAEDMYDCNYMMFRNVSFGDKWFYAFITSIDYISNQTARINYEIDVMQTWLNGLDFRFEECFVDRAHTPTDFLFEHIVPEDFSIGGEYVVDRYDVFDMSEMKIYMFVSEYFVGDDSDPHFRPPDISWINKTPNGLGAYVYDNTQAGLNRMQTTINDFIRYGHEQSIVSIQLVPSVFSGVTWATPVSRTQHVAPPTSSTTLGGTSYVPKNRKLYSYPYNKLVVSCHDGQPKDYKWELWGNGTSGGYPDRGTFFLEGVGGMRSTVICYPGGRYRKMSLNIDDGIVFDKFPLGSWTGDAYKAFWAQNYGTIGMMYADKPILTEVALMMARVGGMQAVQSGLHFAAGDITGGALSLFNSANAIANAINKSETIPNRYYGDTNSSNILMGLQRIEFMFVQMSLKEDYLRILDNYFTKFGYARKEVMAPQLNVRPHWTYVRTIGCNINANLPADDTAKICAIMDNGITFWRNGNEVGDYTLNNSPST